MRKTEWKFTLACLAFVLFTSFFTYVARYDKPAASFWDESYYITDAQKEINNIFYMQIHPPLGKQLIALGEIIINANDDDTQFLSTEHANKFPEGFSFVGYRFIPVMLAWLTAPLLFLCFLLILENPAYSVLLSFLYIFDNATIVHSRGAMIDSTLSFFFVFAVLLFLILIKIRNKQSNIFRIVCFFIGTAIAAAVTTKWSGVVLILLPIWLIIYLRRNTRNVLYSIFFSLLGFVAIFFLVFLFHFRTGTVINPELKDDGYFNASFEQRNILDSGRAGTLGAFKVQLADSLRYVGIYNRGIPKLDLCKSDENGSPPFLWPIGAMTINYLWGTADNGAHRYLNIIANPAVWWSALLGVILASCFVIMPIFGVHSTKEVSSDRFLMSVFLSLYFGYLAGMSMTNRVNFIHSYLPALLFGFLILACVVNAVRNIGNFELNHNRKGYILMALSILVFLCFHFFKPFTYYETLSPKQVENRAILDIWNLHCVGCKEENPLVRRQC